MILGPLPGPRHSLISKFCSKNRKHVQSNLVNLESTGLEFLFSIKNPIKQDLLLILVLVRQQNFLNC